MIAELKRAGRERERLSEGLERLKDLAAPPTLPDELPLARSIQQIKETQRTRDVAESIQSALRSLPTPPALADVDALSATTERLRAASAGKRRAAVVATELQTLQTPPAPADESPLRQMLLRLKQANGAVAQMHRAAAIATDEVAAARQEAIAFITENPKCPLCNGELDVEQLLTARGHEHV
jgi:hypothetical protein